MRILFRFCLIHIITLCLTNVIRRDVKLNVVLFFADNSPILDDSGIKMLNFERKRDIRDCTIELENKIVESIDGYQPLPSKFCNCEKLLKSSLLSLINYCKNVLDMTTVVASSKNDTLSNDLRIKKSNIEFLDENDLPSLKILAKNYKQNPLLEVYPLGRPKLKFNIINKWSDRRSNKEIITEPEHTESFKIRTKRQQNKHSVDCKEYPSFCGQLNKPSSLWNTLGIMSGIRLTFFKTFFEKPPYDQENAINYNILGKTQENSLFNLVQKALQTVQNGNCKNGFLMIVFGGLLSDISNINSPLLQSVKHIVENTNEQDTLIVVTASCPKFNGENYEFSRKQQEKQIPVYIKGAYCNLFSRCMELYDLPYVIKNILSSIKPFSNEESSNK